MHNAGSPYYPHLREWVLPSGPNKVDKAGKLVVRVLRKLLWAGLFVTTFAVSTVVLENEIAERWFTIEVGKDIPPLFPVLVITPGPKGEPYDAQVVYYGKLAAFLRQNPHQTFLVPEGLEDFLQSRLAQKNYQQSRPEIGEDYSDPWFAAFRIKRLSNGRQYLEVSGDSADDYPIVGRYEATETEIFPRYFRAYNARALGFALMGAVFLANLALWGIGFALYKRFKEKRLNQAAT